MVEEENKQIKSKDEEGKKKDEKTKDDGEKIEMKKDKEKKTKEKKQDVKKEKSKPKKDKAIVRGVSLRLSPKHCFAICKMLKGKTPERAIEMLGDVIKKKRPVPMHNREVAHQKGKGIAGAKFPETASIEMIKLMKQASANANINEIENPIISLIKADKASQPHRREGRRAKRCHVYIEIKSVVKKLNKKMEEKK